MQTYAGITRAPKNDEVAVYCRERMDAAIRILERIIGQDIEDELEREMDRARERLERRKQNLMMAENAMKNIMAENGLTWGPSWRVITLDGKREGESGQHVLTEEEKPLWLAVRKLLQDFWVGE